jgi:hypothetical protein
MKPNLLHGSVALWRSAVILMTALAAAGCDESFTFRVEVRVNLSASPDPASSGATLTFTFSNEGDATVRPESGRFEFIVSDASGAEVRRLPEPSQAPRLQSEESLSVDWDQRDETGFLVPSGGYRVSVRYRAEGELRQRSESFAIGP